MSKKSFCDICDKEIDSTSPQLEAEHTQADYNHLHSAGVLRLDLEVKVLPVESDICLKCKISHIGKAFSSLSKAYKVRVEE